MLLLITGDRIIDKIPQIGKATCQIQFCQSSEVFSLNSKAHGSYINKAYMYTIYIQLEIRNVDFS